MALRVGVLSSAHVHASSFLQSFAAREDVQVVGLWDDDAARGKPFAEKHSTTFFEDAQSLLSQVDAVAICSENLKHADHIEMAAKAGKHILCEKPIAANREQADRIQKAVESAKITFMTAFPCPFSPTFHRMKSSIASGEIGKVLALSTTNRGTCPFGWFVERDKSGGGAMIDHVVHVADLLRRLLGEDPETVFAQTGNNMNGQEWEDVAHLTVGYPSGVFATIDSSWSRPTGYKIWGDVTLKAVGEVGLIEADLFGQGVDVFSPNHSFAGSGSNLDALMVAEFVRAVTTQTPPLCTLEDGLMASRLAHAAYESVASGKTVIV